MARALSSVVGIAALALAFGSSPARADCVPWRQADDLIRENGLVSGKEVYDRVKEKTSGDIITASLCQSGNKFFYKIVLLSPRGTVTNVSVDARTGQF